MGQVPKLKHSSHRWPSACAFIERDGEWGDICEFQVNMSQNMEKISISWSKNLFHIVARNENGKMDA